MARRYSDRTTNILMLVGVLFIILPFQTLIGYKFESVWMFIGVPMGMVWGWWCASLSSYTRDKQ